MTELCDQLAVIEALTTAVELIKVRNQRHLAATQLAGEDHLMGWTADRGYGVHKPNGSAPLHFYLLVQIIADCDLPPGCSTWWSARVPMAGAVLAGDRDMDLESFTGSVRAGREIGRQGAEQLKRVHPELGGKTASIVLDDADLALAARDGVPGLLSTPARHACGGAGCWCRRTFSRQHWNWLGRLPASTWCGRRGTRQRPPRWCRPRPGVGARLHPYRLR